MLNRFRRLGGLWGKDRRGTAALEFGLVAFPLLLVVFGGAELAMVLNQYLTLTNATIVGAEQFAFSAGVDATPYADAVSAIEAAAPTLTPLGITLVVNGAVCTDTSSTTCATALSGGTGYVTVTVTYSCAAINLVFNLLPDCRLTAKETERVQ